MKIFGGYYIRYFFA